MKNWLYIVFILLVIPIGFAQQVHVNLSVDQKEVEIGVPVIVTISSNVEGEFTLDIPSDFSMLPGVQSGKSQQVDYQTGKKESIYFMTRTGSFQREGKYDFRATLKTRKKTYKSNSLSVTVKKKEQISVAFSRKETRNPVFGKVEVQKKTIYEGESVLVNGKIYTKYDLAVESYQPIKYIGYPEIKDLTSNKDPGFSPVTIQNQQYYYKPFDKKLFFFNAPGKYEIGPFKMGVVYETSEDFINLEVNSNKEIIEVLPLPANGPSNFNGGIGEFKLTRNFDQQEVKQGDVIVMKVEIAGTGNLQNIQKPELTLPQGVIQYGDAEVQEAIVFQEDGSTGKKVYTFHLQFLEKGVFTIPSMEVSYFNPKTKKYVSLSVPSKEVKVNKSLQFENQTLANNTEFNEQDYLNQANTDSKNSSPYQKVTLVLLGVFVPISLGVFLFFFIRRKPSKEVEIQEETKNQISETEIIEQYITNSYNAVSKGNLSFSFQQVEFAIRIMVRLITSEKVELPDSTQMLQKLSELLVACESARYLQDYKVESLKLAQKEMIDMLELIKKQVR